MCFDTDADGIEYMYFEEKPEEILYLLNAYGPIYDDWHSAYSAIYSYREKKLQEAKEKLEQAAARFDAVKQLIPF